MKNEFFPDGTQYHLSNFTLENLEICAKNSGFREDAVENITVHNVTVKEEK